MVFHLSQGLSAHTTAEVHAVILNDGRLARLCRAAGIRTSVLEETRSTFPILLAKLARLVVEARPDIVHAHRYKENILAGAVAPLCGFPRLVTTQHGISEISYSLKARALSWLNFLLMQHAYVRVVAVSNDLARYLTETARIPPSKVTCIHNGIDTSKVAIRQVPKISGRITIGSAGRIVPVKDYSLLVETACALCARNAHVWFVLAGDGPESPYLREMVRVRGLEGRFTLLGHLEDMSAFWDKIDVYVNTSRHEGFPITILEAMSRGLPVVAPAAGGLTEVIEPGVSGCLVAERKAEAFATALQNLIASPDLRANLGMNARRRVEELFTIRAMVHSYYALYEKIVAINRR